MTAAKKTALLLLALLALGALGWYAIAQVQRRGDGALRLSGNIEATEVGISFKIPGRVIRRLVDEGDKVHKDQLIAVLDTADLEAQAALRRAELALAQAALDELNAGSRPQEIDAAEANMAAALVEKNRLRTELGRSRRLFEGKMISQEEYDRAAAAAGVAADRYRQASEQFKLVKAGPRKEQIQQGRAPSSRRRPRSASPRCNWAMPRSARPWTASCSPRTSSRGNTWPRARPWSRSPTW